MKTLNREEAGAEFKRFWSELKTEWFKVEVLQNYSGEDQGESLKSWFVGDKNKSIELLQVRSRSIDWAEKNKDKEFKKIRIHIVEEPYTEYLQWEIEHYKNINIPIVKEDVYLLNRREAENLLLPDGDFMIFDDKKVVRNYYTPEGRMYKADFYDETDDISEFLRLKRVLLASNLIKL